MKNIRLLAALCVAGLVALAPRAEAAQGTGCMPTTGTVSGLTFAQDVNAGIAALISSNSGNSAPITDCSAATVKGQLWLDTSVTPNVLKQYDGTSWASLGALDAASHLWSPPVGGGTASVTAATTTDICAAPAAVQSITGTTTITGLGSSCAAVGIRKTLIFNSATPLTYNSGSLIIPGQQNYTTSVGDVAEAVYLGSGNWRIISITKIDGSAITNPAIPLGTVFYGDYATAPAKTVYGYGQAISRASYPAYFSAVTRTQSGTLTAGNNTITGVSNTAGLGQNMPLEGTGIQAGTVISSVTSSTIVMSKTATANGAQSISAIIPGYGSGGDSTTVGVKDCRGRTLAGRDDMGGTAANRLTSTYFGAISGRKGTVINDFGGIENQSLSVSQIPDITSSGSNSITVNTVSGAIVVSSGVTNGWREGTGNAFTAFNNGTAAFGTQSSTGTNSISVASQSTGGSSPVHPNVQPTSIAECVVAVLP